MSIPRKVRRDPVLRTGIVSLSSADEWGYIYKATATKPAGFSIGDGVDLPDGRRYRLALAGGVILSQFGAYNPIRTIDCAILPAQTGDGSVAADSKCLTVTVASTNGKASNGVIGANELAGGMIVIGNGSGQSPQSRGILGNTAQATAGAGTVNIYLDGGLTTAVTVGTTTVETLFNPYGYMLSGGTTSSEFVTFHGVPAVACAAGYYFWLQTKGRCWITSNSNTCNSANDRTCYFVGNGSVVSGADVTYAGKSYQIAGVGCDTSATGTSSNAPWVDLACES